MTDPVQRAKFLTDRLPEGGLFDGKSWRISPDPFLLTSEEGGLLEEMGPVLASFQDAALDMYLNGPEWVGTLVARGKPAWLVELGRQLMREGQRPGVIRPDLVWTEEGPRITELDAVPGGIGLLTWLMRVYEEVGVTLLGGSRRMAEAFSGLFDEGIIVSEESGDYLPEMQWLSDRVNEWFGRKTFVRRPWELEGETLKGRWYRFFELFDLDDIPGSNRMRTGLESGDLSFSPPWTVANEEKLWLALYRVPQLRKEWADRLPARSLEMLDTLIPEGWLVTSESAPPWAVISGLNIPSWREAKGFSQKERRMALKISGYSPIGWGARSVVIGHDVPAEAWAAAIDTALADEGHIWVAQRFHTALARPHRWWDGEKLREMMGRTRVCPYYFRKGGEVVLGGALATVCPEDKKILHGMTDAVLTPVAVG